MGGLGPQPSVREYRFTNLKQMPIQVDGEVMDLGAGAKARIETLTEGLEPEQEPRLFGPTPGDEKADDAQ